MQEEQLPAGKKRPKPEWKDQIVWWGFCTHGLPRHQEGVDRVKVVVADMREVLVRQSRIEMRAVARHAVTHRPPESCWRPVADTGRLVRGYVRPIKGAEGGAERSAARVGRSVFSGVTDRAVADRRQRRAALDQGYGERPRIGPCDAANRPAVDHG